MITEHSERARYVTTQVALWVANDYETYKAALYALNECKDFSDPLYLLRTHITMELRRLTNNYAPGVAGWHVAQELAPNDYARINWVAVADEISGE